MDAVGRLLAAVVAVGVAVLVVVGFGVALTVGVKEGGDGRSLGLVFRSPVDIRHAHTNVMHTHVPP